jgi:hypothetical protein
MSDYASSLSVDGRYVVFESAASTLVPGDTNGSWDVFVRDRETDTTERVSVGSTGEEGNDTSYSGPISADGRYVVFLSWASNLVPEDTNGVGDVFLHDRLTGQTELLSVSSTGEQGDGESFPSAISADGRYVAFHSYATNLVPGDTNGTYDVFVHDRETGATERVSIGSAGEQGNGQSLWADMSPDARCVAFSSDASNLVPGDTNGATDILVRVRWRFQDVPPEQWAFAQVDACVSANVVKGYSDETYRPSDPVTRDQMAIYISRGIVAPSGDAAIPTGPAVATFSDVPTDHWAYKWVEYAVDQNVVQGYPDGTYRPDQQVDRGQMAIFVARGIVAPNGDAAVPTGPAVATFPDVPTDHWAYKWVEFIADEGVTQGYDDGTYRPAVIVTRDQMAVYVQRAFTLPM